MLNCYHGLLGLFEYQPVETLVQGDVDSIGPAEASTARVVGAVKVVPGTAWAGGGIFQRERAEYGSGRHEDGVARPFGDNEAGRVADLNENRRGGSCVAGIIDRYRCQLHVIPSRNGPHSDVVGRSGSGAEKGVVDEVIDPRDGPAVIVCHRDDDMKLVGVSSQSMASPLGEVTKRIGAIIGRNG
jgi:hypothetical protein